jgi:hypothetical protein
MLSLGGSLATYLPAGERVSGLAGRGMLHSSTPPSQLHLSRFKKIDPSMPYAVRVFMVEIKPAYLASSSKPT